MVIMLKINAIYYFETHEYRLFKETNNLLFTTLICI